MVVEVGHLEEGVDLAAKHAKGAVEAGVETVEGGIGSAVGFTELGGEEAARIRCAREGQALQGVGPAATVLPRQIEMPVTPACAYAIIAPARLYCSRVVAWLIDIRAGSATIQLPHISEVRLRTIGKTNAIQ